VRQQLPPRGRTLRGNKCCEGRAFEDSNFRIEIQSLTLTQAQGECGSDKSYLRMSKKLFRIDNFIMNHVRTLKTRFEKLPPQEI
jgi:hypothetical protein